MYKFGMQLMLLLVFFSFMAGPFSGGSEILGPVAKIVGACPMGQASQAGGQDPTASGITPYGQASQAGGQDPTAPGITPYGQASQAGGQDPTALGVYNHNENTRWIYTILNSIQGWAGGAGVEYCVSGTR